ncbi:MAG: hypothetical protein LBB63_01425 [Holosporaceae bacterium]|nr:hypothetical protein [Holosporaceae bacterium]
MKKKVLGLMLGSILLCGDGCAAEGEADGVAVNVTGATANAVPSAGCPRGSLVPAPAESGIVIEGGAYKMRPVVAKLATNTGLLNSVNKFSANSDNAMNFCNYLASLTQWWLNQGYEAGVAANVAPAVQALADANNALAAAQADLALAELKGKCGQYYGVLKSNGPTSPFVNAVNGSLVDGTGVDAVVAGIADIHASSYKMSSVFKGVYGAEVPADLNATIGGIASFDGLLEKFADGDGNWMGKTTNAGPRIVAGAGGHRYLPEILNFLKTSTLNVLMRVASGADTEGVVDDTTIETLPEGAKGQCYKCGIVLNRLMYEMATRGSIGADTDATHSAAGTAADDAPAEARLNQSQAGEAAPWETPGITQAWVECLLAVNQKMGL